MTGNDATILHSLYQQIDFQCIQLYFSGGTHEKIHIPHDISSSRCSERNTGNKTSYVVFHSVVISESRRERIFSRLDNSRRNTKWVSASILLLSRWLWWPHHHKFCPLYVFFPNEKLSILKHCNHLRYCLYRAVHDKGFLEQRVVLHL